MSVQTVPLPTERLTEDLNIVHVCAEIDHGSLVEGVGDNSVSIVDAEFITLEEVLAKCGAAGQDWRNIVFPGVGLSQYYRDVPNAYGGYFKILDHDHPERQTHFLMVDRMGNPVDQYGSLLRSTEANPVRVFKFNPELEVGKCYVGLTNQRIGARYTQVTRIDEDGTVWGRVVAAGGAVTLHSHERSEREVRLSKRARWIEAPWFSKNLRPMATIEHNSSLYTHTYWEESISRMVALGHVKRLVPRSEAVSGRYYLFHDLNVEPGDVGAVTIGRMDSDGEVLERLNVLGFSDGIMAMGSQTAGLYKDTEYWGQVSIYDIGEGSEWKSFSDSFTPIPPGNISSRSHEWIRGELGILSERWDKISEAINECANENSYCSEFEESVMPLGFEGRESHANVSFYVDIDVDFTYVNEGPASHQDREMNEVVGFENEPSFNRIEASGSVSVRIYVNDMPRNSDSSDLGERIDSSDIESEMPEGTSIDDWEISDYGIDD